MSRLNLVVEITGIFINQLRVEAKSYFALMVKGGIKKKVKKLENFCQVMLFMLLLILNIGMGRLKIVGSLI